MSQTVDDVKHRLKRLKEAAIADGKEEWAYYKMGDQDADFMVKEYDMVVDSIHKQYKLNDDSYAEKNKLKAALSYAQQAYHYGEVSSEAFDERIKKLLENT
jgi:hypothetical protein